MKFLLFFSEMVWVNSSYLSIHHFNWRPALHWDLIGSSLLEIFILFFLTYSPFWFLVRILIFFVLGQENTNKKILRSVFSTKRHQLYFLFERLNKINHGPWASRARFVSGLRKPRLLISKSNYILNLSFNLLTFKNHK